MISTYIFDLCKAANPIVIFKDYEQIKFAYEKMASDSVELNYDFDALYFGFSSINVKKKMYYFDFDSNISNIELNETIDFGVKSVPKFGENFTEINKYVKNAISNNKTVVICIGTTNVNRFLDELDFSYVLTDFDNVLPGKVNIVNKRFSEGFEKDKYIFNRL